ncbi:MAG: GntR family transcriptional regulator [Eubacteriales bacterium]|nr:GntR family transcriptional regulator [Eubacteriales bacterium]
MRKTVVDITMQYILNQVSSKKWKPGSKIPTEFELMETLDVSRNTVREAIKVLEYLGLLEIRRADGTYVVNHFSEKMLNSWSCSLLIEDEKSTALLELRMVIESGIFSLASKKGTEDDMKAVVEASENFIRLAEDEASSPEQILEADLKYRETICNAADNQLASRINSVIAQASYSSRKRTIEETIACGDRFHMVDSHRKLTDTIINRRWDELDGVLTYCFKYWGVVLQNKQESPVPEERK